MRTRSESPNRVAAQFGDSSLRGLTGFGNSLEFEADGSTPTRAVCIARDRERIVGTAGAAGSCVEGLWEVGVDVAESCRNAGLGTYLVRRLTEKLTARKILPFNLRP